MDDNKDFGDPGFTDQMLHRVLLGFTIFVAVAMVFVAVVVHRADMAVTVEGAGYVVMEKARGSVPSVPGQEYFWTEEGFIIVPMIPPTVQGEVDE